MRRKKTVALTKGQTLHVLAATSELCTVKVWEEGAVVEIRFIASNQVHYLPYG